MPFQQLLFEPLHHDALFRVGVVVTEQVEDPVDE